MMMGSRIIAPEGYSCLKKGDVYYFLNSDGLNNRVRLVLFSIGNELNAHLITLGRIEFEHALEEGLVFEDGLDKYPPWLSRIQGISILELEARRKSAKQTYDQMVNHRYLAIAGLVECTSEVLAASKPGKKIAEHASTQPKKQHPTRLSAWFYTYIIFGRNKWSLLPRSINNGYWDRTAEAHKEKLGRPSRKGRKFGFHADRDMRDKILEGFLEKKSMHKNQNDIYREVLVEFFGCVSVRKGKNSFEFIHPEGAPFPTFRQFWYAIKKQVPARELNLALKGRHELRKISGSVGEFAELISNVNQVVEFDGYYISENPAGMIEGSAQTTYCVLRGTCLLSGAVTAIGFAYGKETMEAYRMALFCMAINKVKFFELFGCVLDPEEWPCEGLSADMVFDRGPGANFDCLPEINWLGVLETTPTFSGQSKATVESSHPRDKHPEGPPSFFHSDKNFIALARREIWQVVMDNASSHAKGRMNDDMILSRVAPSPRGVWGYWDSLGRNSSVSMEFETAVRTFLTPIPVMIAEDAVWLHKRKYRSKALIDTGVFDRVARRGKIQATAYVLTMCVRHIWVEVEGVLYELDVVRSVKTVEGTRDLTLTELSELAQMWRDSEAEFQESVPAIQHYYRDQHEQATGDSWSGGTRKRGRAPKNAAARRDSADTAGFTGKTG